MGEIADAMISGKMCTICGCYFKKPGADPEDKDFSKICYEHGYPAVCSGCWKDMTKEEKQYHTKAKVPTL